MANEHPSILSCTYKKVHSILLVLKYFQFSIVVLKAKQLQWSVTINTGDMMNQQKPELRKVEATGAKLG